MLRWPHPSYFEKSVMEIVPAGASVAEFGASAGENTLAALLAGAHVTAVDVADEALALLKRRLPPEFKDRVTTLHSSFETCPLEDESCDHILSAGSLSYVENDNCRRSGSTTQTGRQLDCGGFMEPQSDLPA